jgi:hypothetical protein
MVNIILKLVAANGETFIVFYLLVAGYNRFGETRSAYLAIKKLYFVKRQAVWQQGKKKWHLL